jgi:methionyl-tRNA formyltransferase
VKLFGARPAPAAGGEPGEVLEIARGAMAVKCGGGGAVRIAAVQPAGRKRMSPEEWARGRRLAVGDRFASDDAASAS